MEPLPSSPTIPKTCLQIIVVRDAQSSNADRSWSELERVLLDHTMKYGTTIDKEMVEDGQKILAVVGEDAMGWAVIEGRPLRVHILKCIPTDEFVLGQGSRLFEILEQCGYDRVVEIMQAMKDEKMEWTRRKDDEAYSLRRKRRNPPREAPVLGIELLDRETVSNEQDALCFARMSDLEFYAGVVRRRGKRDLPENEPEEAEPPTKRPRRRLVR